MSEDICYYRKTLLYNLNRNIIQPSGTSIFQPLHHLLYFHYRNLTHVHTLDQSRGHGCRLYGHIRVMNKSTRHTCKKVIKYFRFFLSISNNSSIMMNITSGFICSSLFDWKGIIYHIPYKGPRGKTIIVKKNEKVT